MSNFIVRKVAVLGSGVMGAQIAALCINAKVPVVLFDLVAKEGLRNGVVLRAIEQLKKLNPAPLGDASLAQCIEVANYEDDLHKLSECDLVIEAIAERMDWKHGLYEKVSPHIAPHAVFASNTSGLSIEALSDGFSDALKSRFCGVHFFNPPRYMHLVELIPTPHTQPALLNQLETFLTTTLGKGVVRAKDTPNFVANRVGIFSILATMRQANHYGLPFDVVDDLTGSKLGRAKSATFRTADVVGLDTMAHVIKTMQDTLPHDPFAAVYAMPPVLSQLVAQGALGQKTKAGFFKKEGHQINVFNVTSAQYIPSTGKADDAIAAILKGKDAVAKLKALRESSHPQGQFLWAIFRDVFHYIAVHLEAIAHTARDVDFAMRWGFGWNVGPFEVWQSAGWSQIAAWVKEDVDMGKGLCSAALPAWVFDEPVSSQGVHNPQGSWSPASKTYVPRSNLPVYQRQVLRTPLQGESQHTAHQLGATLQENESVRIWTAPLYDDVLVLSIKTKMHTIGANVLKGIRDAIALAESKYKGLVLWSPDGPFSAGADLQSMLPVYLQGGAPAIEPMVADFQNTSMAIKYSQVPVVAAIDGLALGGGCEFGMHCAARVATFEAYIGLVEVGVGLIPAGGGLKEIALRAAVAAQKVGSTDYIAYLKNGFMSAATAAVSKSGLEARTLGFLTESDAVVFNTHELLHVAIGQARQLFDSGYRPPLPANAIAVAGKAGIATILSQLVNMREGGFISAHDYALGKMMATVVCGGQVEAGALVDEAWLLALERKYFVQVLDNPKTQERLMGMLQTGKPVRN